MMSPFTLTRTCSRISARSEAEVPSATSTTCDDSESLHHVQFLGIQHFNLRRARRSRAAHQDAIEHPALAPAGSCFGFRRISSFVNPASPRRRSPGASTRTFPRPTWQLGLYGRVPRPTRPSTGTSGGPVGQLRSPLRRFQIQLQRHRVEPATAPGHSWTTLTSRAGSTFACGLNFMTTRRPSRSMVSTPSRSAMMRMRPYSARFSTESGGGP